MIIRERPGLLQVIFTIRGSVLQRIYPQIILMMILSVVVVWAHKTYPTLVPVFSGAPFALMGVALSIFIGFRNSTCYDRWWEARKHWGQLVASSRDLARQSQLLEERGEEGQKARQELLHLAVAFPHALVEHLRHDHVSPDLMPLIPETERAGFESFSHKPAFILLVQGRILAGLRARGLLDSMEFNLLDATLEHINGVLAACERLRNTPVPYAYTLLLLRTAYLFCLLVPFGFADVLGWTTPFAAAVFAYTFFGLDALGDELEEPFGSLPNDLPIHALSVTIERGLREAMGEPVLPEPIEPNGYFIL